MCLLFLALACVAFAQNKKPSCTHCMEWNLPQKPFQIFGNTYYVGPQGLSSVLITSESGDVLIDGALPESAQQIAANIRSLGFRVEDVKLILNSHVHFDHAGGIAGLQKLSGARVIASEWSASVMKQGGVSRADPQYGIILPIPPVKHVKELRDGQTFHVGEIFLTAHSTPGHTPGGTSWTWKSCEADTCRNLVYADSVSPVSSTAFKFSRSREYPKALADFDRTFAFLDSVPCDVLITPHPDASGLMDRIAARDRGEKPNPLVNPGACRALADYGRAQLRERMKEEGKP